MLQKLKEKIKSKKYSGNIFWKTLFFGYYSLKIFLIVIKYSTGNLPPPKHIVIDPVNICNLNCPLCPTGTKKINYKKCIMSLTAFKTIINKIPS